MLHRIKDEATPKTGGVKSHASQTAASRFELYISNFVLVSDFDIRISDFPRSIGAYYAKQTQFATRPYPQMRETNPIWVPENAKRTQFTPPPPHHDAKNAKRTQSTAPRYLSYFLLSRRQQPAPPNLQPPIYTLQSTIQWPNFCNQLLSTH